MPPSDTLASLDALRSEPAASRLSVDRLRRALEASSSAFRSATSQHVSYVADETIILDSNGSSSILLPELPVTGVSAVTVDGLPVNPAGLWSADGILRRAEGWPRAFRRVTVTYSHGFDPVPADVVDAVIEAALRRLAAQPGQAAGQATAGPFTYQYDPGASQAWSEAVGRYRRRW
jgi:hypothetical protein